MGFSLGVCGLLVLLHVFPVHQDITFSYFHSCTAQVSCLLGVLKALTMAPDLFYYLTDCAGHTFPSPSCCKNLSSSWRSHFTLVLCIWFLRCVVFYFHFPPIYFVFSTDSFLFSSVDISFQGFRTAISSLQFLLHILKFGAMTNIEAMWKHRT